MPDNSPGRGFLVVCEATILRFGSFFFKSLQVSVLPVPEGAEIIMGKPFRKKEIEKYRSGSIF